MKSGAETVDAVVDDEVLAAWRVLVDRGLVAIEWQGLVPVGVLSPDVVCVHVAAHQVTS